MLKKLLGRWTLSSFWLNFILALYFTLILNYSFFREVLNLQPFTGTPSDYFLLTLPVVLFCALNIVFNILSLPILHKIIMPLFILISATISYNSVFYNIYFDRTMLENVLQTSYSESSRLVTLPFVLWVLVLGVIPAILYLLVRVRYKSWGKELLSRVMRILMFAVVIVGVGKFYYQDYASFFRNNKMLPHLIYPSNFVGASISKTRHYIQNNMPFLEQGLDAEQDKPDSIRHVNIIVVGETTRAQNWGLNGYSRQTTPKLAGREDQIINFNNFSSCGTATAISVPCMFSTLKRTEFNMVRAAKQDNILDMLQRAGVDVLWIDNNSDCKNVCDRVNNVNLIDINVQGLCRNGECLDEVLLPEIDKALSNPTGKDLMIVVHVLGSHGPTYYERYTPEFRQFTPTCDTNEINRCTNEELVNTYDNGILYLDNFLEQIIQRLEKQPKWESSLFYISDHGESLGENGMYLHSAPYAIAPDVQTKVPATLWLSEKFIRNEPFDLKCLKENAKNKAYSHDNVFHSIVSLTDMNTKLSKYDESLDILAECRK